MVVNLHGEREHSAACVERIRRSFGDRILLVDSLEDCNTIVFAFKAATPLSRHSLARGRGPRLRQHAARSLRSAFGAVERALQELEASRLTLSVDPERKAALES